MPSEPPARHPPSLPHFPAALRNPQPAFPAALRNPQPTTLPLFLTLHPTAPSEPPARHPPQSATLPFFLTPQPDFGTPSLPPSLSSSLPPTVPSEHFPSLSSSLPSCAVHHTPSPTFLLHLIFLTIAARSTAATSQPPVAMSLLCPSSPSLGNAEYSLSRLWRMSISGGWQHHPDAGRTNSCQSPHLGGDGQ